MKIFVGLCAALITVGLAATPASAHVEIDPTQGAGGAPVTLTISVPNEHSDANTVKIELLIPSECTGCSANPTAPGGWSATFADSTITWTGGKISGDARVSFSFTIQVPNITGTLVFKALQTYDTGEIVRWVEPPNADGSEPAHPAPFVAIVASAATTTSSSTATTSTNTTTTTAAPVPQRTHSNSRTVPIIVIAAAVVVGALVVAARLRQKNHQK